MHPWVGCMAYLKYIQAINLKKKKQQQKTIVQRPKAGGRRRPAQGAVPSSKSEYI